MPRDRDVPLSFDGSWQRNGSVWSKRISFLISFVGSVNSGPFHSGNSGTP